MVHLTPATVVQMARQRATARNAGAAAGERTDGNRRSSDVARPEGARFRTA
jgi:hypothetical protein